MKEEINAYNNVLELIGNTPLIKLNRVTENFDGNFYAKVEAFNPGHSTKDRIALFIIEEAEKRGILSPGDTIIETTSGNTGFSLAKVLSPMPGTLFNSSTVLKLPFFLR